MENKIIRGIYPLVEGIEVPVRSTKYSAGYDLRASEDIVIPSILKIIFTSLEEADFVSEPKEMEVITSWVKNNKLMTLIPTGLSLKCASNECLLILPRSGIANKTLMLIPNAPGLIDSDYSGNEIKVGMINLSPFDIRIKKGERIAQAVFTEYLTATNEEIPAEERTGGFGSTGK